MFSMSMGTRCTIDNIQELKRISLEALEKADGSIEIDISSLVEIDTAGVQLFVAGMKEAAKRKISVTFKGPLDNRVADVFRISGVRYGELDSGGETRHG